LYSRAQRAGEFQVRDFLAGDLHGSIDRAPPPQQARRRRLASSKLRQPNRGGPHLRDTCVALPTPSAPRERPARRATVVSMRRITTRSTPRTSRALLWMPGRRAHPDRGRAAEPGDVTLSAGPSGLGQTVSRYRRAYGVQAFRRRPPLGKTAHRATALVDQSGLRRASASPPSWRTRTMLATALANRVALDHHHGLGGRDLSAMSVRSRGPPALGVELTPPTTICPLTM
jgi:hypothetical protein